jgi:predicted dehydrogenase
MAYSVAEAQTLLGHVETSKRQYAVSYMKRFDAGVLAFRATLQEILRSGEMGELLYVHVRDFCPTYAAEIPPHINLGEKPTYRYEASAFPEHIPQEQQADFDYSLNVMSHDLNLLHFLFGPIFTAERLSVKHGHMQLAVLSCPQCEVILAAGRSDHGKWDQTVEIGFSRGRLLLRLTSPMNRQHAAHYEIERPQGHEHMTGASGSPWAFQAQASHFIDQCLGTASKDISLDTSGKNGLVDLLLIEKLWGQVTWKR